MKTKKYLFVIVRTNNGTYFNNHLKLSEVRLINQLLENNSSVDVRIQECLPHVYKSIFG